MSDSHYIFDLENEIREMAVDSYDEVHKQITIDTERVYPIITDWLDIPQNMVSQLTECFYPNYEEAYERSIPNRRFQINLRGQIYGDFDYVEFIRALIKFTDKWDYAKWWGHFHFYDSDKKYSEFRMPIFANSDLYDESSPTYNADFKRMYDESYNISS